MINNKDIQANSCNNVHLQQKDESVQLKDSELKQETAEIKPESSAINTTANTNTELKRAFDNPDRLEPTRYGDWEKNGRCIDF